MPILDGLPDGWAAPSSPTSAHAKKVTLAALSERGEHPVSKRLAAYDRLEGNYAGASFAELQPTAENDISVADLHAASLLSIEIGPRTTRRLLNDGNTRNDVSISTGQACPACGVFSALVHQRWLQRITDLPYGEPLSVCGTSGAGRVTSRRVRGGRSVSTTGRSGRGSG